MPSSDSAPSSLPPSSLASRPCPFPSNSPPSPSLHQNHAHQPPSRSLVFLTVSFYLLAALVMVFVNKWVLNSIPAPVFFLFCQLMIAVILLKLSALAGWLVLPKVHLSVAILLWKLVGINVLGLTFNTYCLQYVDASFYQVARGLILPFTVLASYIFLGTGCSTRIKVAILAVCLGFLVGVGSERLTVSGVGVILGVCSSVTTSMHAIIVKQALNEVSSTVDLTYYSNLLSALVVLPGVLLAGELPVVIGLITSANLQTFLLGTLVTGLFGFLICLAGFLSIKVTSPVTHMISSAVRGVFQTALGAAIFGDAITPGRLAGIAIILCGSLYYTWVKDQELHPSPSSSGPSGLVQKDRFVMRHIQEQQPLVINIDEEDEELQGNFDMDPHHLGRDGQGPEEDDEREIREAERALGIHHGSEETDQKS